MGVGASNDPLYDSKTFRNFNYFLLFLLRASTWKLLEARFTMGWERGQGLCSLLGEGIMRPVRLR